MSRGNEQHGSEDARTRALSGHVDDWTELAVDYLDGRLTAEIKSAVEGHLGGCPACAARLTTQQGVVSLLQGTSLDDPPENLEDRILGEILFPSQRAAQPKIADKRRETTLWRGKIRPWIPATVAVAALLGAVVGYGLLRSDADVSTTSRGEAASTVASKDQLAGAPPSQPESLGAVTTVAAATTTAVVGATISPASESTVPAPTQDRKAMVNTLKDAQAPAYLAFETPTPAPTEDDQSREPATTLPAGAVPSGGPGAASSEQVDAVVSQMLEFTGLQPLDDTQALGGPTFAAYVPRDNAAQLVDLMRSIAVSLGLDLTLSMAPPAGVDEAVARLLERKAQLPVLIATRTPQPAVSGYTFTTSTLATPGDQPDGTPMVLPDDSGTHVLVVFYVRR